MDENKMKIALIGVGYWGKNLMRVFCGLRVLDMVYDLDRTKLEEAKKTYPTINIAASYKEILNNNLISAVVVATSAESHYQLAKEALLAGKDVFVEKPLALSVEEGIELIDLAKKNKMILMVGHLLEYHPAIIKLKELITSGELGKIHYIYSNRLNLGKFRREENILWSFAPHDISVLLSFLNEMPESVFAHGGNYLHQDIADVTVSVLNFAGGVKGHIFVSWLHPYKEQKFIVIGDKKMAVFDDVAEQDKLLIFNHKIDWIDRMPVPKKENADSVNFDFKEPLLLECSHFLDCLQKRATPKTDGQNALRVLRVLNACQRSLANNGVMVNLDFSPYDKEKAYYGHPTAIIEEHCDIGDGTRIWHYSHIMRGAIIGRGCNIGQNVFIAGNVRVGNNVKIQNNVSVYERIRLEDDVFCGPSVVFTNVINPRSHISRRNEFKETLVKKGATLGANATLVCGNVIGEYAFVGAGAVVTKDVPSFALVCGNPAVVKGWMCACGIKLQINNGKAVCRACGEKYVYGKGKLMKLKSNRKKVKK